VTVSVWSKKYQPLFLGGDANHNELRRDATNCIMPSTRGKKYTSAVSTPPDRRRLRKDGGPYCTDFGLHRNVVWNGNKRPISDCYFFCSPCVLYEIEAVSNKRIKRDSNRFRCKAKHSSYVHPTHLLKKGGLFNPSKNPAARKTVDSDESSVDSDVISIDDDREDDGDGESSAEEDKGGGANATPSVLEERYDLNDHAKREEIVSALKKQVDNLNTRNQTQRQELRRLKKKMKEIPQANTTLQRAPVTTGARNNAFKISIEELLEDGGSRGGDVSVRENCSLKRSGASWMALLRKN
jgi:hypothetical protein